MKVHNKFTFTRKKRKDHQSLLGDTELGKLSDFQEIDERHEEARSHQDQSQSQKQKQDRDDVEDDNMWSSVMPYQIATINEGPKKSKSDRATAGKSQEDYTIAEDNSNNDGANILKQRSISFSKTQGSFHRKPHSSTSWSNKFPSKIDKSISGDLFDDLHSIRDRIIYQVDSLEDIMNEKSTSKSTSNMKSQRSFKLDLDSAETEEHSGKLDSSSALIESSTKSSTNFPVDPKLLKKRGILIVDPKKNGEIYHMTDNNKNLTDKELIIIGQEPSSFKNDDDDDMTMMSTLTDVTYQKSKEERVKYIMNNLKEAAAQIPESRLWCNMFECANFSNNEIREKSVMEESAGESVDRKTERAGSSDPSMVQNAKIFLNSLYAVSSRKERRNKVEVGSFSETVIVCITRIYLSLHDDGNDGGLRCTYNEPKLCHDLGVHLIEGSDGQAIVASVLPNSTAKRSGVKVGDVLSFAVPLNNTFQGYEKACDFISRLELIGMRTSYREIFDMFLSKTSSGWPIATVFRRGSMGMKNFENMPLGLLSVDIMIDLSRASSFFHGIVTMAREYDYYRESNGVHEMIRGNIETFIPKPQSRASHQRNTKIRRIDFVGEKAQSFGLDTAQEARWILVPKVTDENFYQQMFVPESRRSSLLTWYTENSDAILYLKFTGTFGGSGVIVTRIKEGTWSAPCAIGANVIGCGFRLHADPIECIIFVRDMNDVEGLKQGEKITLGGEVQKDRVAVVTRIADSFCKEMTMKCSCYPRNDLNSLLYSESNENCSVGQILGGYVKFPADAIVFGGALRRLELPSTMYPHPTPPNNLARFSNNDWTAEGSCKMQAPLEPPFDESSIRTLRDLLKAFHRGESVYEEESNEFDIFTQKFRQMLYDGVTIDRAWSIDDCKDYQDNSLITKVTMKLETVVTDSGNEDTFLFLAKSKASMTRVECDFSSPGSFPKKKCLSESLDLRKIVYISQTMPKNFMQSQTSLQEARKQRKRFVMLRSKDGKGVPFLARTAKDASLLACGLKLLAERVYR